MMTPKDFVMEFLFAIGGITTVGMLHTWVVDGDYSITAQRIYDFIGGALVVTIGLIGTYYTKKK